MSIGRSLRTAVRAGSVLLEESARRVAEFVMSRLAEDGGFKGRAEQSDLYYTSFALTVLNGLGEDFPSRRVESFLRKFGNGSGLDLVHAACLARCWNELGERELGEAFRNELAERILSFRSADGGYSLEAGADNCSAYASFLALAAIQDLGLKLERCGELMEALEGLRLPEGGYSNDRSAAQATVPSTAAALVVLSELGAPVDQASANWLLSQLHPAGGFCAVPRAPFPDLLSTATALHALRRVGVSLESIKERCLDFLNSLWSPEGGFCGVWGDRVIDCEYTFYGLVALGNLCTEDPGEAGGSVRNA